jgi:CubicO group peptidase (beta-lactamase class C family)
MKKLLLILALSFSLLVNAQTRFEKIDQYLSHLNQNDKFMGAICIREEGTIVYEKAFGFADVDKNIRANKDTKYKIGSITKTFTATMIMQLVEEKKLKLDTKLSQFFPNVKNANKITIEHLLYQRTGIIDYLNADSTIVSVFNAPNTKELILEKIDAYDSLFEPNSKYEYSNSNYYLLGEIIEQITKKTFAENLNVRIVKKLKLENTYYKTELTNTNQQESYSYIYNGENWEQIPEWKNEIAFSAGAIMASPADVTLFMHALFNGKLVSKKSLEIMTSIKEGYGVALMQFPFGDRKYFGHTGGIESFRSVVGYNTQEKMTISLIVNGDNYNRNDIMIGVLSIYYKIPFPLPKFEKIDLKTVENYLGTYSSVEIPLKIEVFEKNGQLLAQANGQSSFPLTMKEKNTYVFAPAAVEIKFEEETFILSQGGMKYHFKKDK